MPIRKLKARQILDSRGEPTVEVDLVTDIGLLRSSVPGVIHPCENGAKEVRDGDESIYNGRSVNRVIESINNVIAPELLKSRLEVNQQREIDSLMNNLDGTDDKSKLGVNAILAVSMAVCKASAAKRGLPLYRYIAMLCDNTDIYIPVPAFNVLSGGRSAGNNLVYQEYLILPTGAVNFAEAMRVGAEVYRKLEFILAEAQELKRPLGIVDEGGFAPELEDDPEAVSVLMEAVKQAGHEAKIKLGLDVCASAFCKDGMYDMEFKTGESDPESYLEPDALNEQYAELMGAVPQLVSFEDPFDQEDWNSWANLYSNSPNLHIVADDLVATNPERLEEAIEKQAANCVLIKLSNIGTVTEAINVVKMARGANWGVAVSAGQGETEDSFVADFAVGVSAGSFKAGAPCRSERVSKYNQILRIEEELGQNAKYAGEKFKNPFHSGEE